MDFFIEIFSIWLIFSLIIGIIGSNRKIGFGMAFLWSIILSPIIGLVIALFSKKKINLEDKPLSAEGYFKRGISRIDHRRYAEAIHDFSKAIELAPNNATAFNNRGNAKVEIGDYEGAFLDYKKSIEIDPNDSFAYFNRGRVKANLGDFDAAMLDLRKAGELGHKEARKIIKESGI